MGGEGTVGCWIVTIGDELINGQRVDTNTNWLAGRLAEIGIGVSRAVSVGDDESAIRVVLSEALEEADVVILSGGLTAPNRLWRRTSKSACTGMPQWMRPFAASSRNGDVRPAR